MNMISKDENNLSNQLDKERDRNMISNSLKVFRKYVSDSGKFQDSVIKKIINLANLDYSLEEFGKEFD